MIYFALRKFVGLLRKIEAIVVDRRIRTHCDVASSVRIYPQCKANNNRGKSAITISDNTVILGRLETYPRGGQIDIGKDCFIGEGTYIWSANHISIGNRVLISHNVNIHDHNSHSLSAKLRHKHFNQIFSGGHPDVLEDVPSSLIAIEDDAWICFNSIIMKGVTIGKGAVVAAGSVVTKDVDPYTIVAGNPARRIGQSRE